MALSNEEMRSPHPNLAVLSAFVDARLAADEREIVVLHLTECVECRTILGTYARAVPDGATQANAATAVDRPPLRRPLFWLPIAATLVIGTAAGLLVWRSVSSGLLAPLPNRELPNPVEATSPTEASAPARPAAGTPPAAPPAPSPSPPESVGATRSGDRVVGGKTFRLAAGEWVDAAYDPLALLRVETIEGQAARAAALARVPALAPFAALGRRVTVVHDGVVYRFIP